MMKNLIQKMKNHKKTTFIMLFTLFLSMFFLTSVSIYRDSRNLLEKELAYENYGLWQGGYLNSDNASSDDIKTGRIDIISNHDNYAVLGSFDKNMLDFSNLQLLEGRYPKNDKEIIIDTLTLEHLKKPFLCDQDITLMVNDKEETFKVTGIIAPYRSSWIIIDNWSFPSIITTNRESEIYASFIYDDMLNKETVNKYQFDFINEYSYPELITDELPSETIPMNTIIDIATLLAGMFITGTIFYQFLLKRKKRINTLCMLGISTKTIVKESIMEGIFLVSIAIPLGILISCITVLCIFIFMNTGISVTKFYTISWFEILTKASLLIIGIIVLFTLCTRYIIYRWERNIRYTKLKVVKHRSINSKMILPGISILCIICVITTKDLYFHYIDWKSIDNIMNIESDYVYEAPNTRTDISKENIYFQNFKLEGISNNDIQEISNIYGIEKISMYGYSFPVEVSIYVDDKEYYQGYTTFNTLSMDREDMEKFGIELTDKEYESFIAGENVFLLYSDNHLFKEEYATDFTIQFYSDKDQVVDYKALIHTNKNNIPFTISRIERVSYLDNSGGHLGYLILSENYLCSEAFIKKYFGVSEGPYQFVAVNASKDADYNVTDKQMASFGFNNYRIERENMWKDSWNAFMIALVSSILIYFISIAVIINMFNAYIYAKRKQIGMLQIIGISNTYIQKKYYLKTLLCIPCSMIIAMLASYLIDVYNYFMQEKAFALSQITLGLTKEDVWNAKIQKEALSNSFRYNFYTLNDYRIIIIYILFLVIVIGGSYYSMKRILNESMLDKINKE